MNEEKYRNAVMKEERKQKWSDERREKYRNAVMNEEKYINALMKEEKYRNATTVFVWWKCSQFQRKSSSSWENQIKTLIVWLTKWYPRKYLFRIISLVNLILITVFRIGLILSTSDDDTLRHGLSVRLVWNNSLFWNFQQRYRTFCKVKIIYFIDDRVVIFDSCSNDSFVQIK